MTKKYHINKHGVPALCRATKGNCPYGGKDGTKNHYSTLEEAQSAADKLNGDEFPLLPTQKSAFKTVKNEDDEREISDRIVYLKERSAEKVKEGKSSNYVDRCRDAEFLPEYRPNNKKTSHFKDDRANKDSRLDRMYGEGEVLGYYRIDHIIKEIDGKSVYGNQIAEIRNNGKIVIYDYDTGRKVTTFMAHEERVEVMMLRSNQIPDGDLLKNVKNNFRNEAEHRKTMRRRQERRRKQLSRKRRRQNLNSKVQVQPAY